jgi:Protein of unknown function (DUF1559)
MRLSSGIVSMRPKWLCGASAVVVLLLGSSLAVAADAPRANAKFDPLAYVPSDAAVFAHLRFGEVWNGPLLAEIRKTAGKDMDKLIELIDKELGIPVPLIESGTFFFPVMPAGPGDETTFIAIFTTAKPYDKDKLMTKVRAKDAKVKDGMVELDGRNEKKLFLKFASDTTFVILHETLVEKFNKGPVRDDKVGVMTDALKLARDKHQFVLSLDLKQLPNEIFTNAPDELKPFLPLFKCKSAVLTGDLKDKELKLSLNFRGENADAAKEAEESFKLLMKLAGDGLLELQADKDALKEYGFLLPLIKALDKAVKSVKIVREGDRLETSATIKLEFAVGEAVAALAKKINDESARGERTNNLRQIGIAMHNYHDTYQGFPASAICDKKGKPLLSWRVSILPYIEQQELYKEFKLDEPWDSDHNKKLIEKMPKIYALPNVNNPGKTHFRVFTGGGAVFDVIQQTKIQDISDGTSNTVMVVESAEPVIWTKPEDLEFDPEKPIVKKLLRFVDDVAVVAFCDGSARFIKKKVEEKTWALLIQKNDGTPIPNLDE